MTRQVASPANPLRIYFDLFCSWSWPLTSFQFIYSNNIVHIWSPCLAKESQPTLLQPKIQKKSKGSEVDPAKEAELKLILDKRWSLVSVSRNADYSFRLRTRDLVRAYTYICLGRAPWKTQISEDEEDESEDEELEQTKNNDQVSHFNLAENSQFVWSRVALWRA